MTVKLRKNKKSMDMFDNNLLFWQHEDKEFCLHVFADEHPTDPRSDGYGHLATMACFHPRYILGDRIDAKTPGMFWDNLVTKHISETELADMLQQGAAAGFKEQMEKEDASWDNPEDALDLFHDLTQDGMIQFAMDVLKDQVTALSLWLYDHSGITMSCGERTYPYNDRFDSSDVGWIVMDKVTAMKELGTTEENWKEKAYGCMQAEVDAYDKYLRGDVYWFTLYSRSILIENDVRPIWESEWDDEDSCSDFYGSDIYENGILENVGNGLAEALESGNYTTGNAKPVVTTTYKLTPNNN